MSIPNIDSVSDLSFKDITPLLFSSFFFFVSDIIKPSSVHDIFYLFYPENVYVEYYGCSGS